jgi:hypothetical protein
MEHDDGYTYIFLIGARKNFHHDVTDDWFEYAYERFDFVECGVFRKPTSEITEADYRDWVIVHGEEPEGWMHPSTWGYPAATAGQITEVQPMDGPVGAIFTLRVLDEPTKDLMDALTYHCEETDQVMSAAIALRECLFSHGVSESDAPSAESLVNYVTDEW